MKSMHRIHLQQQQHQKTHKSKEKKTRASPRNEKQISFQTFARGVIDTRIKVHIRF